MKILVSVRFGSSWSCENPPNVQMFMLTYQPMIDALEKGETLTKGHPAILQFVREFVVKFPAYVSFYIDDGLENLEVQEVSGSFIIIAREGYEEVDERDLINWLPVS